jgi:hypothetical protein
MHGLSKPVQYKSDLCPAPFRCTATITELTTRRNGGKYYSSKQAQYPLLEVNWIA